MPPITPIRINLGNRRLVASYAVDAPPALRSRTTFVGLCSGLLDSTRRTAGCGIRMSGGVAGVRG